MEIKKYRVNVTAQAKNQMQEIARYIAVDLQNPEAALHILDCFEEMMRSLQNFPQRIPLTDEKPWKDHGIHRAVVRNYLMYFWMDEDHSAVLITAVVYGGRDQQKVLAHLGENP